MMTLYLLYILIFKIVLFAQKSFVHIIQYSSPKPSFFALSCLRRRALSIQYSSPKPESPSLAFYILACSLPDNDRMSTKQLLNSPDCAVDEALSGLVASHPGLRLLEGHRVVIRADIQQVLATGKVGLSTASVMINT